MGFDANVEFLRLAFWQILIISGPLLAVALAIGLAIGILQAATSIQEMTLTFVPKLILVVGSYITLLVLLACLRQAYCQIGSLPSHKL